MQFFYHSLLQTVFILFLSIAPALAQSDVSASKHDTIRMSNPESEPSYSGFYRFYTHFYSGYDTLPFWFYANRHGLIRPGSSNNLITGFASETALSPSNSRLHIRIGAELVNRFSDLDNTLHFQQFYGTAKYRKIIFRAGWFYRMNDFDESLEGLTTGFFIESHNATPYPRISLETDGFVAVPKTGETLLVRFRYSDGLLESDRFISSPFIHHKSVQLRAVFNRLSVQLGVFHSVIWAGVDEERGQLPRSFDDYMRIVFSRSAAEESDASGSEVLNRLGNSVGVYEVGFTYEASRHKIVGYRHFFLENEFAVRLQSPWDGIWALGFIHKEDDKTIQSVVYEHMNSIRQESMKGTAQGRANIYNHGIYTDGWSYHGRLMGNPLFTFDPEERRVINNVIVAHHLGITGHLLNRLSYRSLLTYSRNYGLCTDQLISGSCTVDPGEPIPENLEVRPRNELRQDRFSGLLQLNYLLSPNKNFVLHTGIAADAGDFWGRRFGFFTGFSIGN